MPKRQIRLGFTIVELMVVIVVIGILATLVFVTYTGVQSKVIDSALLSDIDRINIAELKYIESHGNSGKEYYSGNGTDADLNFTPSSGNVIDVAKNTTDYCIRGYNEKAEKNSILNAYTKGSTPTACSVIPPSLSAGATIDAPNEPIIAVGLDGSNVLASITPVTCSTGTPQYGIDSRTNDGAWSGYSSWSAGTTATQSAVDGIKYGYRARARCYVDDAIYSLNSTGNESTYTFYNYDSLPIATSISGYWSTPPTGYLAEDGSAVSRTTYSDLFAVIGTTYGAGDGSTTFNLPDSRGRVTVNINPSDTEFDTIGETYGEKSHLLTGSESGEKGHNHTQNAHSHSEIVSNSNGYGGTDGQFAGSGYSGATHAYSYSASGLTTATNQAVADSSASSAHNEIQPSIVKMYAIKWRPSTGSNSKLPAGTSTQGYFTSAPAGYLVEDGSAVSRTTYSDLFAAIGTTYGAGDGSTTFNLPDSRGRIAVNINSADVEFATIGQKYGEKTHLLTSAESGEHGHNHLQNAHLHQQIVMNSNGYGGTDGQAAGSGYSGSTHGSWATSSATATNQAISASSASTAHNNIQPSIVKLFIIKYAPVVISAEDNPAKGTSISGYWSTTPAGYLLEDGSAVSRTTYEDLFAVIGTTYGVGDGSTTFNLPDSRGRASVNKNSIDTEFDTIGERFGEKTHLNTGAESGIKGHNHLQNSHNHYETVSNSNGYSGADGHASGAGYTGSTHGSYSTLSVTATNQAVSASNAASGHNNIQPSIVQMFVIKY